MKTIGILIAVAALSGCATMGGEEKIAASWQGAHIDDVIVAWGVPSGKADLSSGGAVYQWNAENDYGSTMVTTTNAAATGPSSASATSISVGGPTTGRCSRKMVTNAQGIIQSVSYQGNDCCVVAISGYCASLVNPKR